MRRQTRRIAGGMAALMVAPLILAGCSGPQLEVDPSSFAGQWLTHSTDHFVIHFPPDSPRADRVFMAVGAACEEVYTLVGEHLGVAVSDPIQIYVFTTNSDCEAAIGRSAVFVEAQNIYTRIGAEIGGAIALAGCYSIDPDAASFPMIKDGLRTVFDERNRNVHHEASALLTKAGRWFSLQELLNGGGDADAEAYRYATASFVAYLIQQHGSDRFRMLWRSVLDLRQSLERIYGMTLDQLEREWMDHMAREAKRS